MRRGLHARCPTYPMIPHTRRLLSDYVRFGIPAIDPALKTPLMHGKHGKLGRVRLGRLSGR
jgi:hypothetical protein